MGNILEQIRDQVNALSPDEVRAQLLKLQEQKAKQAERQKAKGPLTAEQLEKRRAYNAARLAKPEVKEKMKAYHAKPEVKERMKTYRETRAAKQKSLLEKAKSLGLIDDKGNLVSA